MSLADRIVEALSMAFRMFWEILWALILGFGLSAVVQAAVSKSEMSRLLPDDSPRSIDHRLGPRVGPPGYGAEVYVIVKKVPQAEMLGERRGQE